MLQQGYQTMQAPKPITKAEVALPTKVNMAIKELGESISELGSLAADLRSRLSSSVLSSPMNPGLGEPDPVTTGSYSVPLADSIQEKKESVEAISRIMKDILQRLEV